MPPTPAIGGWEGVGEIHSVGSAVVALSPGDLVIHAAYLSGNYSNYSYIFVFHIDFFVKSFLVSLLFTVSQFYYVKNNF